MSDHHDHAGMAALSICEALLLAMNDHKLLPENEIVGVLEDAARTHEKTDGSGRQEDAHRATAALIRHIIAGGNSVHRS